MRDEELRVLLIGAGAAESSCLLQLGSVASAFGPFAVEPCARWEEASALLGVHGFDAVLLRAEVPGEAMRLPHWPGLSQATPDAAVIVWLASPGDASLARRLVEAGVQDVIAPSLQDHGCSAEVASSLRLAVERKRIERAARKACATDLQTGLPNRQQLIEHMSQLLALRGREPAPIFSKEGSVVIIEFKAPGVNLDEHVDDLQEYAILLTSKSKGNIKKVYGYIFGDKINMNRVRGYTRFPSGDGWFNTEPLFEPKTGQRLGEIYSEILFYPDIVSKAEKRLSVYRDKLGI